MDAFERELLTLLPRLRRFARSLARDPASADDLTQTALERAIRNRPQGGETARLDAWVMKIMRNCWIDEYRSRARSGQTFVPEELAEQVGGNDHGPVVADRFDLGAALLRLSDEQREVVGLVLVEGFSYREASDLLEIPMGTLTSRLNRARHSLAQYLEVA